ncbi:MAG TPA: FliM/FliN family flagellar motor switch protein [Terracidiphilus sp.]|nr:FliM/FliN family flagellar motor switch protein [Terracidiphilus sp.]
MTYLDCWIATASALFSQAVAGEPEFVDSMPRPMEGGAVAFSARIGGDEEGRFTVALDQAMLAMPLLGEGADQKAAWGELLREVADATAGKMLAEEGKKCHVEAFEESPGEAKVSRAFQLKFADWSWTLLVRDEVRPPRPPKAEPVSRPAEAVIPAPVPAGPTSAGIELLLDVELEATLRFGCRELPLGEMLELGPGDVVHLDRHITEPADLIVGDKIVARGEVVLVNGNFGLRVTEVAAPRKRLETIRCLF